eukprot:763600-Hanusia_phi.AAC.2
MVFKWKERSRATRSTVRTNKPAQVPPPLVDRSQARIQVFDVFLHGCDEFEEIKHACSLPACALSLHPLLSYHSAPGRQACHGSILRKSCAYERLPSRSSARNDGDVPVPMKPADALHGSQWQSSLLSYVPQSTRPSLPSYLQHPPTRT